MNGRPGTWVPNRPPQVPSRPYEPALEDAPGARRHDERHAACVPPGGRAQAQRVVAHVQRRQPDLRGPRVVVESDDGAAAPVDERLVADVEVLGGPAAKIAA